MIVRKPYAFLIKHFRLLHVILSVLMIVTVFQTIKILNFFNEYLSGFMTNVETGTVSSIFFDSNLIY